MWLATSNQSAVFQQSKVSIAKICLWHWLQIWHTIVHQQMSKWVCGASTDDSLTYFCTMGRYGAARYWGKSILHYWSQNANVYFFKLVKRERQRAMGRLLNKMFVTDQAEVGHMCAACFLNICQFTASFSFIFVHFSFQYQLYSFNNTNWKKHRWCAWDSSPGPQDCRHRRNHGAMAAAPCVPQLANTKRVQKLTSNSWSTNFDAVCLLQSMDDTLS